MTAKNEINGITARLSAQSVALSAQAASRFKQRIKTNDTQSNRFRILLVIISEALYQRHINRALYMINSIRKDHVLEQQCPYFTLEESTAYHPGWFSHGTPQAGFLAGS
jgi:hypothetical protein